MKISVATLLLASSANAFTAPSRTVSVSALSMTDVPEETISEEPVVAAPEPVVEPLPTMSQAMPFMARPAALDGSMAGDVGFDPLGFAKNSEDLMNYREAEIKHARLAMLVSIRFARSSIHLIKKQCTHLVSPRHNRLLLAGHSLSFGTRKSPLCSLSQPSLIPPTVPHLS